MAYTVKTVADLAGVSVRTLHHYDQVGLLRPAAVSPAGYRLYSDSDLERLQQILFFKELGFGLQEIRGILESPAYDQGEALRAHRKLLTEKRARLDRLIDSVDKTITTLEGKKAMDKREMFEAFDDSKLEEYKREARERWGGTKEYEESERRAASYSKADWDRIQAEAERITAALGELVDRDPGDPEVQALIDQHFHHINDNFYTVKPEVYRGLADLYVSDERFTAYYERVRPGLAQFMHEAMNVYCDRKFK
ncbi:MAG: MerR family transcriptional regulator [Chitinophagales bacterium]